MGGTFIHWFQPNVWHETMRDNLEVEQLIDLNQAYWISGDKVHKGTQDDEFRPHAARYENSGTGC